MDKLKSSDHQSIGLDINFAATQKAKEKGHQVIVADAQALPFASDTFPRIISLHTTEHLPDKPRTFAELARVLKPDGLAVIVEPPNFGGLETIRVALEDLPESQKPAGLIGGIQTWVNALRHAHKLHCSTLGGPLGGAREHAQKILDENHIPLEASGGMRADLSFANLLTFTKSKGSI